MKRANIAVFFDGTGQNRSLQKPEEWTNVVLLHDALNSGGLESTIQHRKYVDGVGTRKEESLKGGMFGIGLDERIEEAYAFLYEEYNNAKEDGLDPHIYIFGFSRGAYAARWLASLVRYGGIPKDDILVRKIFIRHREGKALDVAENCCWHDALIDYIGVWDTVEASVNPSFDIVNVPVCVSSVRHALAMDEWRFKFDPTRFNALDKVEELWFPGCHADIGGGYLERGLSNAPLLWIAEGAKKAGLAIDESELQKSIDERSAEIRYHDELKDGGLGMKAVWWLTNVCENGKIKFYRTMRTNDFYDQTYEAYASQAPHDRLAIPSTCLVYSSTMSGNVERIV